MREARVKIGPSKSLFLKIFFEKNTVALHHHIEISRLNFSPFLVKSKSYMNETYEKSKEFVFDK